MPKGTPGEKRPGDVIGAAVKVARIATHELEEDIDPKSAAAELGRRGGKARASRLTPEKRREIARRAAIQRWSKRRDQFTEGQLSMSITVEDYVQVDERAAELGYSVPTRLAVVPINFETACTRADLCSASHTDTVIKFFKAEGISLDSFLLENEHLSYRVNKHFQWLGPTLFIPLALLNENPQIVSLAIGVLSNAITDFFKGIPRQQRNVKLNIVVQTNGSGTYKKILYDGDIEGLNSLPKIIRDSTR
jgi:hypothetical protein